LAAFYTHPATTDGHLGKCKECTKVDVKRNRRARLEQYRRHDRERYQNPERRESAIERTAASNARHPDQQRARSAVSHALRDGKLVRRPCENCGASRAEAHHEDYSQPLKVRWLCKHHHEAVHHPF
jgi:ribosomal protein S27AE